ncbi:hypothetical protein DAI22_09g202950 [Oryza sativa Japonica Group]|nr:hypothetical protein DAI22_09g202950 [Oryza sativa Japonica Group]
MGMTRRRGRWRRTSSACGFAARWLSSVSPWIGGQRVGGGGAARTRVISKVAAHLFPRRQPPAPTPAAQTCHAQLLPRRPTFRSNPAREKGRGCCWGRRRFFSFFYSLLFWPPAADGERWPSMPPRLSALSAAAALSSTVVALPTKASVADAAAVARRRSTAHRPFSARPRARVSSSSSSGAAT